MSSPHKTRSTKYTRKHTPGWLDHRPCQLALHKCERMRVCAPISQPSSQSRTFLSGNSSYMPLSCCCTWREAQSNTKHEEGGEEEREGVCQPAVPLISASWKGWRLHSGTISFVLCGLELERLEQREQEAYRNRMCDKGCESRSVSFTLWLDWMY